MDCPVVAMKDPESGYGVSVPDLPGCVSAGTTIDEALEMAREAIELHIEGLIEEGQAVCRGRVPSRITAPIRDALAAPGCWSVSTRRTCA